MRRIAVTGHRTLDPGTRRLVRRGLGRVLARETRPIVGLTCLADGSDQIFAQLVVDAGGSIEAFIASERFTDTLPPTSRRRHLRLRALAAAVYVVGGAYPTPASYMRAGRMMVDRADAVWAVWDGEPARGPGGTADVVAYARERAIPVEVIWPAGAINKAAAGWK